ncbi:hypothetical protein DH86_00002642 [Scytalidium sp. 3C]|nr:hypothetical protein DH86_00002642 [Scytalidium sp. 3C]
MVAPLWTNAFVYMVMGRLVWNFSERAKVLGVHAWRFGLYFVMADILTFIIQVVGAANAASSHEPANKILRDHEVYQDTLDSLPMFLALAIFNAIHPGRIMPGKDSDPPSRRERRKGGIVSKADRVQSVISM